MNDRNSNLHPIFADILNRQFSQVFPVKPTVIVHRDRVRDDTEALQKIANGTHVAEPDRLAELQSDLHIKGEQV